MVYAGQTLFITVIYDEPVVVLMSSVDPEEGVFFLSFRFYSKKKCL
jgi:hypothetical protein